VSWGADAEFFSPPPDPPGGFDIVSMRSWEPNYNIDVIVRAFARFSGEAGDLAAGSRLHLLGGGSMEPALRALARELGVDGRVVFHGRRDDAGMREVLRACRVCVSVPTSDATSVSMLEAMACGLSLVASDLPANRVCLDAAAGGAGGVLVPAGDAAALERALASLARDAEGERHMGRRNRAWVLQHANRQAHMDTMARLYRALKARA
jgi:glycosyltransferase involved in cell wall biosynthesis